MSTSNIASPAIAQPTSIEPDQQSSKANTQIKMLSQSLEIPKDATEKLLASLGKGSNLSVTG